MGYMEVSSLDYYAGFRDPQERGLLQLTFRLDNYIYYSVMINSSGPTGGNRPAEVELWLGSYGSPIKMEHKTYLSSGKDYHGNLERYFNNEISFRSNDLLVTLEEFRDVSNNSPTR